MKRIWRRRKYLRNHSRILKRCQDHLQEYHHQKQEKSRKKADQKSEETTSCSREKNWWEMSEKIWKA